MMFLEILLLTYAVGGLAAPCTPCGPGNSNDPPHTTEQKQPTLAIYNPPVENVINFGVRDSPIQNPSNKLFNGPIGDERNHKLHSVPTVENRNFGFYRDSDKNPLNYEIRYWEPFKILNNLSKPVQEYILKIISAHLPIVNYQVSTNPKVKVRPEQSNGPKKYIYLIPSENGTSTTVETLDLNGHGQAEYERRIYESIMRALEKIKPKTNTKSASDLDQQYYGHAEEQQAIGEVIMLPPEDQQDQQDNAVSKAHLVLQKLKDSLVKLHESLQILKANLKSATNFGTIGAPGEKKPTVSGTNSATKKNLMDHIFNILGKYGYNVEDLLREPDSLTEENILQYLDWLKLESRDDYEDKIMESNDEIAKRDTTSTAIATDPVTVSSDIANTPCKSSSTENISSGISSTTSTTETTVIGNCNEAEEEIVIPSAPQPALHDDDMEIDEAVAIAQDKFLTPTIANNNYNNREITFNNLYPANKQPV